MQSIVTRLAFSISAEKPFATELQLSVLTKIAIHLFTRRNIKTGIVLYLILPWILTGFFEIQS
jgi:hypothetical protein